MLLNLIKKYMNKDLNEEGMLAKDMDLPTLSKLAVSLKLFSEKVVSTMSKVKILKAVTAWEVKTLEENRDKETGLRKLGGVNTVKVVDEVEIDLYNGKAVQSRTTREINGKLYEDVLLVSGETFTNPITE